MKSLKSKTKDKAKLVLLSQKQTGGGDSEYTYDELSPAKQKMLAIMGGPTAIEGEKVTELGLVRDLSKSFPPSSSKKQEVTLSSTPSCFSQKEEFVGITLAELEEDKVSVFL